MKFMFVAAASTSGCQRGCHKFLPPMKNYPTLKFMLLAVAATTGVLYALSPVKNPPKKSLA